MDYKTLIDAETWDFIRKTEAYYPPDATEMSIADQRDTYDRMCRAFFTDYPEGVVVRDSHADGVPIRIYESTAESGTLIYYHGGGFVVGGLESMMMSVLKSAPAPGCAWSRLTIGFVRNTPTLQPIRMPCLWRIMWL